MKEIINLYNVALTAAESELPQLLDQIREQCQQRKLAVEKFYVPLILKGVWPEDYETEDFFLDALAWHEQNYNIEDYLRGDEDYEAVRKVWAEHPSLLPIYAEYFGCCGNNGNNDYYDIYDELCNDDKHRECVYNNYCVDLDDLRKIEAEGLKEIALFGYFCLVIDGLESEKEEALGQITRMGNEGVRYSLGVLKILEILKEGNSPLDVICDNLLHDESESPDVDFWICAWNLVKPTLTREDNTQFEVASDIEVLADKGTNIWSYVVWAILLAVIGGVLCWFVL